MPIATQEQASQYQVLDPCLLGRPVHLLPQFAQQLGDDLARALAGGALRRYWGGFHLESVEFGRVPDGAALRWFGVASAHGSVAVAFERQLLLGLLDWRYGRRSAAGAPARDPGAERVTATEERLVVVLTQQLVDVLAARVAAATGSAPGAPAAAAPASAPHKAAWTVRVALRSIQSGAPGQCYLALDNELMGHVLQALQRGQGRARAPRAPAEPLAAALQVRLDGRLVSKEITLGSLFGLKVGDVIPVSVGRAEVLLDDSRLFTAAVAEHKGKLCLTSFEDAE